MKKDFIEKEIRNATQRLLELARDLTWNKISDHCLYIISEIKNDDRNFFEQFKIKKKENKNKTPKPLADIITDLENLYENLFDVNLYIYKAEKDVTIIEIQYYPRSALEQKYRESVVTKETMVHCKVTTPSYYEDTKEKFDIHWQSGTLNHKWKMFWWRID